MLTAPIDVEIRHFHLFCGLGGGARGFNRGAARVGSLRARFRCLGGIDVDPASARDFGRLAGVPATVVDLFDRDQYRAFHGREPGLDWREAGAEDIRRAAGGERPHIVFLSAPCKGFSGLLSEASSRSEKYQALNRLTLRGVWLMLEAWADDPPELVVFENVPRIAVRGRALLDRIVALLRAYGYATAETTHDCGVIGGLAQSRKRFLLVARHRAKVPPFLYEPAVHRLHGVGEVIGRLPVPGSLGPDGLPAGGPMHRMPSLQWRTWVRLAFVEAGADWRSLNRLAVEGGMLRDFAIVPETGWQGGVLGVRRWDAPSGTVTGRSTPTTGAFAVADPRAHEGADRPSYGVGGWDDPSGTITSARSPGQGRFAVADPRSGADPRPGAAPRDGGGKYRVTGFGEAAGTVIAASTTGQGAFAVADPRRPEGRGEYGQYGVKRWDEVGPAVTGHAAAGAGRFAVADPRTGFGPGAHRNKFKVVAFDAAAGAITGSDRVGSGALSVADPRPAALGRDGREGYVSQGHYGVVPWEAAAGAVTAAGQHDNGRFSVADPRSSADPHDVVESAPPGLPQPDDRLVAVIRALDGTWHRPFTTLELAALQSLVDPEETLELDGLSDSAWRERIGNAVPPAAAEAIAGVMGRTLLLAWSGETFVLSAEPIWVRPVAVALTLEAV